MRSKKLAMSASATHAYPCGKWVRMASSAMRGRALRPVAVRDGQEVRLEDRLQHQLGRLLGHPVADRRDAQCPDTAVRLGDLLPPHGRRTIPALPQVGGKLREQPFDAIGLDVGEGDTIDPRRAPVGPHPPPRLPQDVTPEDAVIQGVEAPLRRPLGRRPELALELAHLVHRRQPMEFDGLAPAGGDGPGGPGHALTRDTAASVTKVGALPSRRVVLHAGQRYYDPVGPPLPSARFHHRLIRSVLARRGRADGSLLFRTRPCARAAPHTPEGPHARFGTRAWDVAFAVT